MQPRRQLPWLILAPGVQSPHIQVDNQLLGYPMMMATTTLDQNLGTEGGGEEKFERVAISFGAVGTHY